MENRRYITLELLKKPIFAAEKETYEGADVPSFYFLYDCRPKEVEICSI